MTTDVREYEVLALDSGAYREMEFSVLKDMLSSWSKRPGTPYTIVELRDGKILAGFAVFSRIPGMDSTFQAEAFVVERMYRKGEVGKRLLEILEEEVGRIQDGPILRFELSRTKKEAIGTELLSGNGYSLLGHIPDFYEPGDDYYLYAKHLLSPDKLEAYEERKP